MRMVRYAIHLLESGRQRHAARAYFGGSAGISSSSRAAYRRRADDRAADGESHQHAAAGGPVYAPVACDLMGISPELANSTPRERDGGRGGAQHDRLRDQPEILKRL